MTGANEIFLFITPFLIMLMALGILYGLIKINKKPGLWEMVALEFIPVIFFFVYLYILVVSPPIETARNLLRSAVICSFGDALYVIYSHLKERGGK